MGLDNFQIKNLAYLVREELPFPVEIDVAPDDADKRDYNVVFKKAQEKLFSSNQIFFVCPGSIRTWFSKILSSHFL